VPVDQPGVLSAILTKWPAQTILAERDLRIGRPPLVP
jgi:hypothetical protein